MSSPLIFNTSQGTGLVLLKRNRLCHREHLSEFVLLVRHKIPNSVLKEFSTQLYINVKLLS